MVDIKIARHTSSSWDIEEDFGQVQESDPLMFYDQFRKNIKISKGVYLKSFL